jgi:hypothetical protein
LRVCIRTLMTLIRMRFCCECPLKVTVNCYSIAQSLIDCVIMNLLVHWQWLNWICTFTKLYTLGRNVSPKWWDC